MNLPTPIHPTPPEAFRRGIAAAILRRPYSENPAWDERTRQMYRDGYSIAIASPSLFTLREFQDVEA